MEQMVMLRRFATASLPSSGNRFLFSTKKAATGRAIKRIFRISCSLARTERLLPAAEPRIAATIPGMTRRRLISRCLIKRAVARLVPQAEDSLLVPMARCMGSPANT